MAARLPVPGSDDGTWGDVLNTFLQESHNTDGTLKAGSVTSATLAAGAVDAAQLADASITPAKLNASAPSSGQVLGYNGTDFNWVTNTASGAVPDADGTTKGLVQLAGDLGGTAAAPTVAAGAITSAKIASGTIVDANISGTAAIATSKISGLDTSISTLNTNVSAKAAKGANSDITSLSGLTTPLSVGQGGTGSASKNFVDLTTAQTVAGVKTFSSSPVVPTPTGTTDAANKAYVDSAAAAGAPDASTSTKGIVQLTGDLAGTATSPSVAKLKGVTLPASAPTTGQVLTATSGTATSWQTPAAGGGGSGMTAVAKTANYTASAGDFVIANATTAGFTVTLPTVANGAKVSVKKVDSTVNAVLVATQGGVQIDDQVSISVNSQWQSQDFFSDGVKWYRI